MIPVGQHLERRGIDIPILATDKFPDPAAMVELSSRTRGRIRGSLEPLDATRLPEHLSGLRTLFNSFHHFGPKLAQQVLQDAYRDRQPIAIFEITEGSRWIGAFSERACYQCESSVAPIAM